MISKPELKRLTSLHHRKYRELYRQYLLEGLRLLEEALSAEVHISKLWHVPENEQNESQRDLLQAAKQKGIPTIETTASKLQRISDTVHHQGIIGLADLPEISSLNASVGKPVLYLEEIRNPGNLGTILRTAWWFGIEHVVLSPQCADPYNPKVVRGGMGAHFNLLIHPQLRLRELAELGHTILAADQNGKPLTSAQVHDKPFCLVMGSEAHGISDDTLALANEIIAIPIFSGAESLNVAVATGILLFSLTQNS